MSEEYKIDPEKLKNIRDNANKFLANWMARTEETHNRLREKYGDDFEESIGSGFRFNKAEQCIIDEWYNALKPEIVAKQKGSVDEGLLGEGEPYYGAVGGGLSYTFTPTSLGTICVVREAITGKELNLAEATDWYFYG